MDSIVAFLKEGTLPNDRGEADKVRRKAPAFRCLRNRSYTSTLLQGRIHFVFTQKRWNHCWRNCMKESMVVIRGEGRYLIKLLLKVTGGHVCRKRHRIMLKYMINARGSPQTSISLRACSILFIIHGHLHNGA